MKYTVVVPTTSNLIFRKIYSFWVLIVTEFVVSETQCRSPSGRANWGKVLRYTLSVVISDPNGTYKLVMVVFVEVLDGFSE